MQEVCRGKILRKVNICLRRVSALLSHANIVVKSKPEVNWLEPARTTWKYFQPGVVMSSDDFQQDEYIDLSFDLNFKRYLSKNSNHNFFIEKNFLLLDHLCQE